MSIAAELDHTVMLVDADLARPSLPRMLGVPEGPGLLDVLEGGSEISDVLLKTNVDKLTLPAQRHAASARHGAAGERVDAAPARGHVERTIRTASSSSTRPLSLLTTEARALAMSMGQIVFVVRADKTLQSAVEHALATIEACPVKMMLLNQARAEKHGGYGEYGLGYGYAYGYGYGHKKTGA